MEFFMKYIKSDLRSHHTSEMSAVYVLKTTTCKPRIEDMSKI